MRFGLDGLSLCRKKTGIGHYTFELARSLAKIVPDHEFEIVSPSPVFIDAAELPVPTNLQLVNAGLKGLRRRGWWSLDLPLYCRRASFALFHGTNFELPYWNTCPTVLTIHDLSLLLYPETHEKHLVRRARLKLPLAARKATAIITPSETVKGEVCERLGVSAEKVFAIAEAARAAFYPMLPSESRVVCQRLGVEDELILFVGTVEPRKNLLALVRAFERIIKNTSSRVQLVIAGDKGWLSDELMGYLRKNDFGERVLFTEHLPDDDLRALYSACRVFVYPSLYEGFGLPLLEAMACGAPVVTSDTGSIRETVGDVARLIAPTDVEELARGITALLDDAGERGRRSAAGIQRAKKFSWERTAAATWEIYQKVYRASPNVLNQK
jgi:glycosyltransferase involved in cell wall biosynthesis